MVRIFIITLFFLNICNAQKKENVYFVYKSSKKNLKLNSIVKIDNHHFKIIENDFEKISLKIIKSKIFTFDNFIKKNKNKKFPDYYKLYNLYIYIPHSKTSGYRVKVEKIWVIDEVIE